MSKIILILDKIKKQKGLRTDKELANLLKIQPNTISTWKTRGTIPYKTLVAYCEQEGVDIKDLLSDEGMEKKASCPEQDRQKFYVADSRSTIYTTKPTIGKIVEMLEEMPDDDLREVLRFLEKEKFVKELIEEKKASKGGR